MGNDFIRFRLNTISSIKPDKEFWFQAESEEAATQWFDRISRALSLSLSTPAALVSGPLPIVPVIIHLHSASDLVAADSNGFSDPYVIIQTEKKASISRAIPKTLAPTWEEIHVFYIVPWQFILFSVWDKDRVTKDDPIGQHVVPMGDLFVKLGSNYSLPMNHTFQLEQVASGSVSISLQLFNVLPSLEAAAQAGTPEAAYLLALCYDDGYFGATADAGRAIELYERCLSEEHHYRNFGLINLALMLKLGARPGGPRPDDLQLSARYTREAAERGSLLAQHNLAINIFDGTGERQDKADAIRRFEALIDQGVVHSLFKLGLIRLFDEECKDVDAALSLLKRAADQGNEQAAIVVYNHLEDSESSADQVVALKYLRMVAEGNAECLFLLGRAYYLPTLGLEQDFEQSLFYLRQAIQRGFHKASFLLFLWGFDMPRELIGISEMLECLEKAADGGIPPAMYHLAMLYLDGKTSTNGLTYTINVEQNIPLGLKYLERAANSGDLGSINSLGLLYLNGRHVEQDLYKAKELFHQFASAGGNEEAALGFINIGFCEKFLGNTGAVLEAIEKAMALGFENQELIDQLKGNTSV